MILYFDCCSLRRLTDDQTQSRVRAEADAVEQILIMVERGDLEWISSDALVLEVTKSSSEAERSDGLALLSLAKKTVQPDEITLQRAEALTTCGYGRMDALHLACAEAVNSDVFLTTDDRLLRRAVRMIGNPMVRVANPVDWLREVRRWPR